MHMKFLFKALLVSALAGGLVGSLLRKFAAQPMGADGTRAPADVPTVNPVTDASVGSSPPGQ